MPESRANNATEWDRYWRGKNVAGARKPGLYDVIASFYRNHLIRPTLNHYITRHFPPGSRLIHAGCGSGEVDFDVVRSMEVTAVDISSEALDCYRRNHGADVDWKKCSIDAMPFAEGTFDGVYNLGVMEHFVGDELDKVLKEFYRVLRPGGKVVLFWPPVYGLSVIALHLIHFVMKWIFRNPVRLHPDEPSKVRSRRQSYEILRRAGLEPVEFGFGMRDMFTYAIVVGQRSRS